MDVVALTTLRASWEKRDFQDTESSVWGVTLEVLCGMWEGGPLDIGLQDLNS